MTGLRPPRDPPTASRTPRLQAGAGVFFRWVPASFRGATACAPLIHCVDTARRSGQVVNLKTLLMVWSGFYVTYMRLRSGPPSEGTTPEDVPDTSARASSSSLSVGRRRGSSLLKNQKNKMSSLTYPCLTLSGVSPRLSVLFS